jgi:hypothetical protein
LPALIAGGPVGIPVHADGGHGGEQGEEEEEEKPAQPAMEEQTGDEAEEEQAPERLVDDTEEIPPSP